MNKSNKRRGIGLSGIIALVIVCTFLQATPGTKYQGAPAAHTTISGVRSISSASQDISDTTARTEIKMSDYGITLSDKDNSFENDLRISKMVENLTGIDKPPYRIIAPKGPGILHWGEASLSWLDQINDVEFVGNGITIQPHSRNNWQGAAFMFSSFYGRGIERPVKPGYRFKTVQKGSGKLYLWTGREISNFYKGQRILIMGRELQGYGYPPNPAFYEWHVVKFVGENYIELEAPLKYSYNDNWQDRSDYGGTPNLDIGKPRIWLLDAPDSKYHYSKKTRFIGFSLAPNPQRTSENSPTPFSSVLFWEGEEVYFENITLNQYAPLWPTVNKIHTAKNCTVPHGIEVDKVTGLVTIDGGSSGGISGATGCEKLIVKNHTHPYCNTSAKYEEWVANKFEEPKHYLSMYPQPEGMHTYELLLQNNIYNTPKAIDAHVVRCIPSNFTLKTGTDITTDGNFIYIKDVEATQYINKGLLPDVMIYRDNGAAFYKVVDVEYTDDKKWKVITTAPPGSFSNGQTWVFERTGYIKDLGGNTSMQWGIPVLSGYDVRWKGNRGTNKGARVTVWNEKDFRFKAGGGFRSLTMVGMIDKITVNVTKPYTGKSSSIVFYDRSGYDDANRIMSINLKQPGIRTLTRGGNASGAKEGDYLNATKLNKVLMELSYNPNISAQNSTLPRFTISVSWRPYENR